jgi:hypothetical protein
MPPAMAVRWVPHPSISRVRFFDGSPRGWRTAPQPFPRHSSARAKGVHSWSNVAPETLARHPRFGPVGHLQPILRHIVPAAAGRRFFARKSWTSGAFARQQRRAGLNVAPGFSPASSPYSSKAPKKQRPQVSRLKRARPGLQNAQAVGLKATATRARSHDPPPVPFFVSVHSKSL